MKMKIFNSMVLKTKWKIDATIEWIVLFIEIFSFLLERKVQKCMEMQFLCVFLLQIEFHIKHILFTCHRQWIKIKSINIYSLETSIKRSKCNLNNKFVQFFSLPSRWNLFFCSWWNNFMRKAGRFTSIFLSSFFPMCGIRSLL